MIPPPYGRPLTDLLHYVDGTYDMLELSHPYPIVWQYEGTWYRFWVPAGFRYDVASIPRIFWPLVSPTELGFEAPLAHDWLISRAGLVQVESLEGQGWGPLIWMLSNRTTHFTRPQVDRLFCYLMRERKPPITRWKRRWAYRMVRAYGWAKKHFTRSEW